MGINRAWITGPLGPGRGRVLSIGTIWTENGEPMVLLYKTNMLAVEDRQLKTTDSIRGTFIYT